MTIAECLETPGEAATTSTSASRSRENSTQHGLTGAGVVLPEPLMLAVARRRAEYTAQYEPQDIRDRDLIELAALGFARFEMAQAMQDGRAELRAAQAQADSLWPLLRAADTLERVRRLATSPERVVADLKLSLGGVEWLLREWELLRLSIDRTGDWTEPLKQRAENLAAVPRAHRHLDPARIRGGTTEERLALIDREIAGLRALLESGELALKDEAVRREILEGKGLPHDPGLDRLVLYERRALRMYEKATQELQARLDARKARDQPDEIHAPFASEFTRSAYIEAISDPGSIARVSAEEIAALPPGIPARMAAWLDENGLRVDVIDSLRGVIGRLRSAGIAFTLPQAPVQPANHPTATDAPASPGTSSIDRDRKARRIDKERHRQRRR
ncbi:MAG: hypothetical protein U0800_01295 [Isosphaeraceae bacterium]